MVAELGRICGDGKPSLSSKWRGVQHGTDGDKPDRTAEGDPNLEGLEEIHQNFDSGVKFRNTRAYDKEMRTCMQEATKRVTAI